LELLLIDDEHYIVEYLKHLINWPKFGMTTVLTTANAIEGRQILDRNQIDVLITDIRMPEVSGIDLLERIAKKRLRTRTIFLSGYSEFEYARKAIRYGLFDYLLKPIEKADLERVMARLAAKLRRAATTTTAVWEKQDQIDGFGYLLAIMSKNPLHFMVDHYNEIDEKLAHAAQSFCFFSSMHRKPIQQKDAWLRPFCWQTSTRMVGMLTVTAAQEWMRSDPTLRCSRSFCFTDKGAVRDIFFRFFFDTDPCGERFKSAARWLLDAHQKNRLGREQMLAQVAQIDTDGGRLAFTFETLCFFYLQKRLGATCNAGELLFDRLTDPERTIRTIVDRLDNQHNQLPAANSQTIIRFIQTYVRDHLSEELTLEKLGKQVYLHPVYLSKLYKQSTGENLSLYVTRTRLDRAAALLVDPELRVADISRLVGYRNPQYFIKLFKERFRVTPLKYRRCHLRCNPV
jgi:two-component system response regulator YesN